MGVRGRKSAGMSSSSSDTITEDEAALYDRQIRLWGLDCQKRLREAKILVIGLNGLGVEIVKNLTLSGVKSITLMDETHVSVSDSSAQFFAVGQESSLGRASASKQAVQELNPRVCVEVDPTPVPSLPPRFFAAFTAVFVTDQPVSQMIRVSKACHDQKVKFYCGDTWGLYGWGFLDLLCHKFARIMSKEEKGEQTTSLQTFDYCPLGPSLGTKVGAGFNKRINRVYPLLNIMNNFREQQGRTPSPSHREEDLEELKKVRGMTLSNLGCEETKVGDDVLSCVFGELSPVCAAVGGVMANEIIKGISCQGVPIHNFLLFDGDSCVGATATIVVRD